MIYYSAGWGGCVVSLIPASLEQQFIAQITDEREGYSAYRGLGKKELETIVFKTVPGSGAGGESSDGPELHCGEQSELMGRGLESCFK